MSERRLIRVAPKDARTIDGIVFASRAECERYIELKLLERAGKIRNLERQPRFPFVINGVPIMLRSNRYKAGRTCSYTADFRYEERVKELGKQDPVWIVVTEDVKGFSTDLARLRIAVAEAIYNMRVRIIGQVERPQVRAKPHKGFDLRGRRAPDSHP